MEYRAHEGYMKEKQDEIDELKLENKALRHRIYDREPKGVVNISPKSFVIDGLDISEIVLLNSVSIDYDNPSGVGITFEIKPKTFLYKDK